MGQPLLNNGDREDRTGRDEMANSPTDTSTELDAMANSHTDTSTDEDQCHSEHVTGNGQTCISFKEINASTKILYLFFTELSNVHTCI